MLRRRAYLPSLDCATHTRCCCATAHTPALVFAQTKTLTIAAAAYRLGLTYHQTRAALLQGQLTGGPDLTGAYYIDEPSVVEYATRLAARLVEHNGPGLLPDGTCRVCKRPAPPSPAPHAASRVKARRPRADAAE